MSAAKQTPMVKAAPYSYVWYTSLAAFTLRYPLEPCYCGAGCNQGQGPVNPSRFNHRRLCRCPSSSRTDGSNDDGTSAAGESQESQFSRATDPDVSNPSGTSGGADANPSPDVTAASGRDAEGADAAGSSESRRRANDLAAGEGGRAGDSVAGALSAAGDSAPGRSSTDAGYSGRGADGTDSNTFWNASSSADFDAELSPEPAAASSSGSGTEPVYSKQRPGSVDTNEARNASSAAASDAAERFQGPAAASHSGAASGSGISAPSEVPGPSSGGADDGSPASKLLARWYIAGANVLQQLLRKWYFRLVALGALLLAFVTATINCWLVPAANSRYMAVAADVAARVLVRPVALKGVKAVSLPGECRVQHEQERHLILRFQQQQ